MDILLGQKIANDRYFHRGRITQVLNADGFTVITFRENGRNYFLKLDDEEINMLKQGKNVGDGWYLDGAKKRI